MKKVFLVLSFSIISLIVGAQITVTNATFPQIGDTLNLAVHANPGIQMTASGGPFEWDYTGLEAQVEQQVVFKSASEGSITVPGAIMVAEYPGGIENYYTTTANALLLVAVKGPVGQVFGIESVFHYTPPREEKTAPMNYQDSHTSSSNLLIPFSTDNIPSAIIDSLGLPVVPDSIRLRIASQLTDEVDAYGTVQLPIGDFEALRVKRTETLDTRVDVLLPFFGWQDVTDVLLGGGVIPGLGNDTTVRYLFLSNSEKEVLVEAVMDSTGLNVQQAIFKNGDSVSAAKEVGSKGETYLNFYPNPFAQELNVRTESAVAGPLEVQLFTNDGKLVNRFTISSGTTMALNLPTFGSGSIYYKVINNKGQIIQHGKLLKQ